MDDANSKLIGIIFRNSCKFVKNFLYSINNDEINNDDLGFYSLKAIPKFIPFIKDFVKVTSLKKNFKIE